MNQWGRPNVNMRSTRSDGGFKNLYISEPQWGRLTATIPLVTTILKKISDSPEDADIQVPIDDQKSFSLKKEGTKTSISITVLKNGEIQQGLGCFIGGRKSWSVLLENQGKISRQLGSLRPKQKTENQHSSKQFSWLALNKTNHGHVVEGVSWSFTKPMARMLAEKEVSIIYHIFLMSVGGL